MLIIIAFYLYDYLSFIYSDVLYLYFFLLTFMLVLPLSLLLIKSFVLGYRIRLRAYLLMTNIVFINRYA